MTKKKKEMIDWYLLKGVGLIFGFLILVTWFIGSDAFVYVSEHSRVNAPSYIEIEDQGNVLDNKALCWEQFEEWATGYNLIHLFSEMRYTGKMGLTCHDGRCMCE